MTAPETVALCQRLQASLRQHAPTLTNIVGVSGLALLAAGSVLPLVTQGFSPATFIAMLGAVSGNVLASWLQTWAERASGLAEPDLLSHLATDLHARLEQDSALAADVDALLEHLDALPIALAALTNQGDQQTKLLRLLLEDGQRNATRAERLLNLVLDAQQHSDLTVWALLYGLRVDVQTLIAREAANTAIRITDSRDVTIRNTGIIAGRDVVQVTLPSLIPPTAEDLAAAQARLAAMPTGDDAPIPAPQPLTVPHRMELTANPYFVGREAALRQIARTLQAGTTCAVTTGIGGIGKTQLAVEFARRYGNYFTGGVFWLSFADAGSIAGEVVACGRQGALGLFLDAAQLKQDEQVALVRAAWEQTLPRLLVFDNCEDPQLLRDWKPELGGCRVLMTSRTTQWPGTLSVQRLALDVLPRAQSVQLLQRYRPDLDDETALDALCAEVGDLPLALHLLGGFLETYRDDPLLGDPAQLLDDLSSGPILERATELAQDVSDSPTQHDLDVARSFTMSYQHLDASTALDSVALALLARAAFFAPGKPIPRDLLLATLQLNAEDTAGQRQAARALTRLTALGLLEAEENALHLHRLLAAFVQSSVHDAAAPEAVEQVLNRAAYAANGSGLPAQMQPFLSHLRLVTERAEERDDPRAATLCANLACHLHRVGAYAAARPLLERALTISEQALGPTHSQTAQSLNNLAFLLYTLGDYAVARPLYQRALAIYEQDLGPEHPDTALSLHNLALLLYAQGDYTAARPLYERALAIHEQALGAEHTHTSTNLHNLAALLYAQGDYIAARPLFERTLAIREQALGPDHPATATSLNNLAVLLRAQGDYAAARPLFERALAISEQALGPDHPDTALSLHDLATLLHEQGDYQAARSLLERALAIREQNLGAEHPHTADSLNSLAALLRAQGDYAAARPLFERALAIREQALGPTHPTTASSLHNLAELLRSTGDYAAARPLYQRALAIREQALGPDHPATATSLNNLAVLLRAQGDYAAAHPLYQRALAIREQALGPDHPATATSLNDLAVLLYAQGDYAAARPLYARALAVYEQALGTEHPSTQTIRRNLAALDQAIAQRAQENPEAAS